MGLGEMMGVKNVKLELKGNYATLADLLEAMTVSYTHLSKNPKKLLTRVILLAIIIKLSRGGHAAKSAS